MKKTEQGRDNSKRKLRQQSLNNWVEKKNEQNWDKAKSKLGKIEQKENLKHYQSKNGVNYGLEISKCDLKVGRGPF